MKPAVRHLWFLLAGASLPHCGRSEFWMNDLAPGDVEEGVETISWGAYTLTLDVPQCPAGAPLVVDTTSDELEGGDTTITDPSQAGPSLSLVEALWIAANRPGQDNISFDEGVFPVAPAGVIMLAVGWPPSSLATDLCIDGRGRGVVLDGDPGVSFGNLSLGANTLLVGLTFLSTARLWAEEGSQIAGCRFGADGWSAAGFGDVEARGAEIGPGNVFGGATGINIWGRDSWVHHNHFGLDPVTGAALESSDPVTVRDGPALIEHNAIVPAACSPFCPAGIKVWSALPSVVIRDNRFGLRALGIGDAPIGGYGVQSISGGSAVIGPSNLMRGLTQAVVGSFTVTRNSIFDNDSGIENGIPARPVITSVTSTLVSGTCSADGTVELFSDAGAQGEIFLASTPCVAGAPWSLGGLVYPRANVTATLTDLQNRTSAFSAPFPVP